MKLKADAHSGRIMVEIGQRDSALPPITLPELSLKKILLPVDFSECSRKALHYAVTLAKQFTAEVLLLHVIEPLPAPPQMMLPESDVLSAKFQEAMAKHLSEWRDQIISKVSVRAVIQTGGTAYHEIVEAARENNVDLIILGTHGRTGLARLLLGGTAERVVRHAPCPVLVVREREHDFVEESDQKSLKAESRTAEGGRKSLFK